MKTQTRIVQIAFGILREARAHIERAVQNQLIADTDSRAGVATGCQIAVGQTQRAVSAAKGYVTVGTSLGGCTDKGFLIGQAGKAPADALQVGLEGVAVSHLNGVLVIGSDGVIGDDLAFLHARKGDAVVVDHDRDRLGGRRHGRQCAQQAKAVQRGQF